MSENARKRPYYRTPKINRPDITVGGVTWTPRARFADELKLAENTIRSWNLQTVYPERHRTCPPRRRAASRGQATNKRPRPAPLSRIFHSCQTEAAAVATDELRP